LPPPRFSNAELRPEDVDFCYGSCHGTLWPVLGQIFSLGLLYDNSPKAVTQRKEFLLREKLGICDIVASCMRKIVDSSDLGMEGIVLRDIPSELEACPTIELLIFTGGNSKNGPEYLFRRLMRERGIALVCVHKEVPRRHCFNYAGRVIYTVTLTSPSNAANRAIGFTLLYKERKAKDHLYTTFDFRVEQYRRVFLGK